MCIRDRYLSFTEIRLPQSGQIVKIAVPHSEQLFAVLYCYASKFVQFQHKFFCISVIADFLRSCNYLCVNSKPCPIGKVKPLILFGYLRLGVFRVN